MPVTSSYAKLTDTDFRVLGARRPLTLMLCIAFAVISLNPSITSGSAKVNAKVSAAAGASRQRRDVSTSFSPQSTGSSPSDGLLTDIVSMLGPRTQVDFVAILDRSIGVGKHEFYFYDRPLVEALLRQYAAVHTDYVRTAVVTFATTPTIAYDDINNELGVWYDGSGTGSRHLTKCELFDGVDQLGSVWDSTVRFNADGFEQAGKNISGAVGLVNRILSGGIRIRPNATRVVLILTDGEYAPQEDPYNELITMKSLATVFSVGVGVWLETGSVRGLASNGGYYGLKQDWMMLLSSVPTSIPQGIGHTEPLISLVDSGLCNGTCLAGSHCNCDIDTGEQLCLCDAGYQVAAESNDFTCAPIVSTTVTPPINPCTNIIGEQPVCQNGGTGYDLRRNLEQPGNGLDYECACACPFGYRGRTCELAVVDLCDLGPCDTNGTATCVADHPGWYLCRCLPGRVGEFCESWGPSPTSPTTSTALPPSTAFSQISSTSLSTFSSTSSSSTPSPTPTLLSSTTSTLPTATSSSSSSATLSTLWSQSLSLASSPSTSSSPSPSSSTTTATLSTTTISTTTTTTTTTTTPIADATTTSASTSTLTSTSMLTSTSTSRVPLTTTSSGSTATGKANASSVLSFRAVTDEEPVEQPPTDAAAAASASETGISSSTRLTIIIVVCSVGGALIVALVVAVIVLLILYVRRRRKLLYDLNETGQRTVKLSRWHDSLKLPCAAAHGAASTLSTEYSNASSGSSLGSSSQQGLSTNDTFAVAEVIYRNEELRGTITSNRRPRTLEDWKLYLLELVTTGAIRAGIIASRLSQLEGQTGQQDSVPEDLSLPHRSRGEKTSTESEQTARFVKTREWIYNNEELHQLVRAVQLGTEPASAAATPSGRFHQLNSSPSCSSWTPVYRLPVQGHVFEVLRRRDNNLLVAISVEEASNDERISGPSARRQGQSGRTDVRKPTELVLTLALTDHYLVAAFGELPDPRYEGTILTEASNSRCAKEVQWIADTIRVDCI